MLGVMFAAFIVQIVFRYFFNFPTGWTSELTVVMWLWLVLWGAAFVREGERGDPLRPRHVAVGPRARASPWRSSSRVAIVVLYGVSLPASFDYVDAS